MPFVVVDVETCSVDPVRLNLDEASNPQQRTTIDGSIVSLVAPCFILSTHESLLIRCSQPTKKAECDCDAVHDAISSACEPSQLAAVSTATTVFWPFHPASTGLQKWKFGGRIISTNQADLEAARRSVYRKRVCFCDWRG